MMLNEKNVCSSDYHYAHRATVSEPTSFWYEDTSNHFDTLGDENVVRNVEITEELGHRGDASRYVFQLPDVAGLEPEPGC